MTPIQSPFTLSSDLCVRKFLSQNVTFAIVHTLGFPTMNLSKYYVESSSTVSQEAVLSFACLELSIYVIYKVNKS